ncbi:DEAD/DEAH box helicase [Nakamurella sp. DB0629]|uniref:RNA helicase n=1 Tax=Nakamurella aerolata TaxID=1656892 RepID=A0A849A3D9_9ACTN|nr:DEAD/DEAH box helicase [Nakamurella aerolata]
MAAPADHSSDTDSPTTTSPTTTSATTESPGATATDGTGTTSDTSAAELQNEGLAPEDVSQSHPLTADAPVAESSPSFADLQVNPLIVQALAEAGIEHTFAIQALTLPVALVGSDLIGQARTGMGKTLGFGVPLLHRLLAERADAVGPDGARDGDPSEHRAAPQPAAGRAPRALVMVPTRELCVQVTRDLHDAAKHVDLTVAAVYGGRAYEPQIAALQAGVDVVVGTPGRLLDLANSGSLVLGNISILVLDEADEMLDLGFLPDIEKVLGMVPQQRQTMLFSATMPGPIITLARSFMTQPLHIRAESPGEGQTHRTTTQFIYRAHALDKVELLSRVLQAQGRGLTMVFTRTKRTAQKVADELAERGFAAAAVHGDLGQGAREQALRAFRSGKVDVLVATDVAARGIDVEGVTHVINYQCPEDEKTYVHRIGRTGRAGRTGVAVTLVDWDDIPRWKLINDALELGVPEPAETYSTSTHLRSDLDIPESATGRLPRSQRTRAGLAAEQVEDLGETGKTRSRSGGHAGRRGQSSGGQSHGQHGGRGRADHGDQAGSGGRRRRTRRSDSTGSEPTGERRDSTSSSASGGSASGGSASGGSAGGSSDTAGRRRQRSRRRTRGGRPASGGASGETTAGGTGGAGSQGAAGDGAAAPAGADR